MGLQRPLLGQPPGGISGPVCLAGSAGYLPWCWHSLSASSAPPALPGFSWQPPTSTSRPPLPPFPALSLPTSAFCKPSPILVSEWIENLYFSRSFPLLQPGFSIKAPFQNCPPPGLKTLKFPFPTTTSRLSAGVVPRMSDVGAQSCTEQEVHVFGGRDRWVINVELTGSGGKLGVHRGQ